MTKYEAYLKKVEELEAYKVLLSTYYYDFRTIAPNDGKATSRKLASIIETKAYELENDPELEVLMKELIDDKSLDEEIRLEIELSLKRIQKNKMPVEVFAAGNIAMAEAEIAWEKAKKAKDYNLFKNEFKRVVDFKKQAIKYRNSSLTTYDELLDDFEPGSNMKMFDEFFDLLKKELVPLIKEVNKNKHIVSDDCIMIDIPITTQKKAVEVLREYLGFNHSFGYLSESEHPFSNMITPNDIRITTNYLENNISSTLFSVAHEIGHALYSHNVSYPFLGSNKESLISMGMHESESRLFENCLARSYSFWEYLYPKLQDVVCEFKNVSLDEFYLAINKAGSSLIRTEADELTYAIHVMIRYELEKEFINGEVDFDNLNKRWNELYDEYLGVKPSNDGEGILQDIHWCDTYGYFPTYALGSAIAAQIYHHMQEKLNVDELLKQGEFYKIVEWLRDNIQKYGGLYNYDAILNKALGESFNPQYYIDYLKEKFTKIYQLK